MQLSSSEEIISRVQLCFYEESMEQPVMFKSGDSWSGLSSVHQKRSEPESSCVSVKSDWSMDPPISFNSGLSSVHQKRSYPESSCVSVKSDWSMDPPISFNSGLSSIHQKRSEPESSCVSVKSDWSMDAPISFNSGLRHNICINYDYSMTVGVGDCSKRTTQDIRRNKLFNYNKTLNMQG